jgi:hypothetical protein
MQQARFCHYAFHFAGYLLWAYWDSSRSLSWRLSAEYFELERKTSGVIISTEKGGGGDSVLAATFLTREPPVQACQTFLWRGHLRQNVAYMRAA